MENQLKKAIEISRKTGDRLIIYDTSRGDEPFVVMSLNEYEKLVIGRSEVRGLTEDELLDKINRDIAIWKSEQFVNNEPDINNTQKPKFVFRDDYSDDYDDDDFEEDDRDDNYKNISSFAEVEEKLKDNSSTSSGQGKKSKRHWMIPSQRKEAAEEVIDEDRQYLERVE